MSPFSDRHPETRTSRHRDIGEKLRHLVRVQAQMCSDGPIIEACGVSHQRESALEQRRVLNGHQELYGRAGLYPAAPPHPPQLRLRTVTTESATERKLADPTLRGEAHTSGLIQDEKA
jgi:hypothetical protein